jgi:hypothetical protein
LDNEPDLWSETHREIHPEPVTYAELAARTIDYATGIKAVDPTGIVFGFVSYGFNGFVNLQNAPDSTTHGDFIDYFLDEMRAAETSAGHRLMDVLDLHWYPEAKGGGTRITEDDNSADMVEARLQAPRSLWDATYVEDSWIARYLGEAVQILPRLKAQIDAHYPDTEIAITEYNYGGYGHISGGIAQADVLGVFGREGLFAATLWELGGDHSFHYAAFDMYRNFDGDGGRFGDTSVSATTSDVAKTSIYASQDDGNDSRVVVVAINKTDEILTGEFDITHAAALTGATAFSLTATAASPQSAGSASVTDNQFTFDLPAMSVTTLALVQ